MTKNTILEAVVGSTAYGLNHADSDIDKLGVFLAPTTEVSGLDWNKHKESWSNSSPDSDDSTLHELGKFLRLTLKGNPTLLELYFMNDYEILTDVGQGLLEQRDNVLNEKAVRFAYHGYAYGQLAEYRRREEPKAKMARHTLRISRQGRSLLESGEFDVRVDNRDEYFELTTYPKETILEILNDELDMLLNCQSILPEEPNINAVRRFLTDVRRNDILKGS